jgi:hypothetical protein
MPKRGMDEWADKPGTRQILLVFSLPKTPKQAQVELSVRKLKLRPFLEKHLLKCLNPEARKGRFYVLSDKARKSLKVSCFENNINEDWELIGWIIASPRQRLVVLRSANEQKLTSEEIRARGTQLNAKLTRISTKNILNELIEKHLVNAEILERLKFYWLTSYGIKIKQEMAVIAPLSPLFSLS